MRFRLGVVVGFAAGYYLGSRAGRERYEQIEDWLDRLRDTEQYAEARTRLTDSWREGSTYARRMIDDLSQPGEPGAGDSGADAGGFVEEYEGDAEIFGQDRPRPIRDAFTDPTLN